MMMRVIVTSALVALCAAVSGCASEPAVEYVQPDCPVIQRPALPVVDQGQLWDAVGDAQYRQIERYINALWGYADEQAAMLEALCDG